METNTETSATPADRADHVTIINERSSGGGSGMVLGIVVLIALAIAAFVMFGSAANDSKSSDAAISAAADKVGAAAEQVGNAAEEAASKVN